MNIEQALTEIARRFDLDAQELIAYSYEDEIGGYHSTASLSSWPVGSIWAVEGRVLYALTRALKPQVAIQIGTSVGCGAAHIAAALKANNYGHLYSVDSHAAFRQQTGPSQFRDWKVGELIPADLRDFVTLITAEGAQWLENENLLTPDLIFEDADHSAKTTGAIWKYAAQNLSAGGVVVSHDAAHFLAGKEVSKGIQDSGVQDAQILMIQPADCGLGIWRKPVQQAQPITPDYQRFIPPTETARPSFDLDNMTRAELRTFAEEHGIELGNLRSRSEIRRAIDDALGKGI